MMPSPELIRATLRERKESARRTFVVGRIDPHGVEAQEVETVDRCAWCDTFPDGEPEGAYVENTTMCEDCFDDFLPPAA